MSRKERLLEMREVLVSRREALCKALAGNLFLLGDSGSEKSEGTGSLAVFPGQEIASRLVEVENLELARINHAIDRMHVGDYGICEKCGNNIPLPRLNALPYATFCIRCQREVEHKSAVPAVEADLVGEE